jgi:hypothetical protein
MRFVSIGFLLFVVSGAVSAQTTLPYTFAPGTVAKASEVNANFQALLTAINKLEGPVTAAGVAGTYVLAGLSLYMTSTPQSGTMSNNARMEHNSTKATAVLNANGTFSFSQETSNGSAMLFDFLKNNGTNTVTNATAIAQPNTSPPESGGTWTLSGNTLTITTNTGGMGTFTAAAGGRLFIGVDASPDNTSQELHILIRTN